MRLPVPTIRVDLVWVIARIQWTAKVTKGWLFVVWYRHDCADLFVQKFATDLD